MDTKTRKIQNFIGGEHVDPAEGRTYDLVNPSTGEQFAQAALSGAEDVDRAFEVAEKAFEAWRDTTPFRASTRAAQDRRRHRGAGRGNSAGRIREHRQTPRAHDARGDTGPPQTRSAFSLAPPAAWKVSLPGSTLKATLPLSAASRSAFAPR